MQPSIDGGLASQANGHRGSPTGLAAGAYGLRKRIGLRDELRGWEERLRAPLTVGSPDKNAHPTLKHLSGHSVRARVSRESPE